MIAGAMTLLRWSFLLLAGISVSAQETARRDPLPPGDLARPAVGKPTLDPVFRTSLRRISDARKDGFSGIFPEYSKRQAWNADESLMLLRTGDGKTLLYDGATYAFKKVLDDVGGEDVFWHPANPGLLYYNPDNTLWSCDVATDERKKLHSFAEYTFANTRAEGNLSRDGATYAFVGQIYDSAAQTVTFKDLVVFDLANGKVAAKLALPKGTENFDWVSISPGGKYVVVDYADEEAKRFHGVEVYDRGFKFLWQKPLGAGHSDLAIDANGDEVLVMDQYDKERNVTVLRKVRLSDGRETTLLEVSQFFDLHISCRNEKRSEWCVVSTFDYVGRLTHDAKGWLPFEDEIFAVKLDGSGEVRRIAHHRSRRYTPATPDSDRSVYFAEPHATVSRKGDRILFGSNWGEKVESEASVDAYVVEWKSR